MKDQIKVGDIWKRIDAEREVKVIFVSNKICAYEILKHKTGLFVGAQDCLDIESFLKVHTLKKPEPSLKKLVLWNDGYSNVIDLEDLEQGISGGWTKKELIIKDGALYVEAN